LGNLGLGGLPVHQCHQPAAAQNTGHWTLDAPHTPQSSQNTEAGADRRVLAGAQWSAKIACSIPRRFFPRTTRQRFSALHCIAIISGKPSILHGLPSNLAWKTESCQKPRPDEAAATEGGGGCFRLMKHRPGVLVDAWLVGLAWFLL